MATILPITLNFLAELKTNNNRDWFNKQKNNYLAAHENVIEFAEKLLLEMRNHDHIETESGKKSLFRIYKDVRFSADKSPYKTHMSGSFTRATKLLRGGYYFHIQPGESFIGGGFWDPKPEDLKRLRQEIAENPEELRKIISEKNFINNFQTLKGEKVKTAPKGFQKDHPAIVLIRHKQFLLIKSFNDAEVLNSDFMSKVNNGFKSMRPFLNYMSEILTTDSNGEPLY